MELLKKLFKTFKKPKKHEMVTAVKSLPFGRKILFFVLLGVAFASLTNILFQSTLKNVLTEVPEVGGTLVEGVVGTPRFINPVLAQSNADKDLTYLVYSGLTHKQNNNDFVLDLASDYFISEDGTTYTFTIREDAIFHDRTKVTAEDIVFTVQKIQDPILKSPLNIQWDGIQVEAKGELTVVFTLEKPYSGFLENTTLGILPKHLWENIGSEEFSFDILNINPQGSGPYKVYSFKKQKSGSIKSYTLKSFKHHGFGQSFIKYIKFKFFENEDEAIESFKSGSVDSINSVSPKKIGDINAAHNDIIYTSPLSRIFGIYFNQNRNSVLKDRTVRQAISMSIDRNQITQENLAGFGSEISSPITLSIKERYDQENTVQAFEPNKAMQLLESRGWKLNEDGIREKDGVVLQFSLATAKIQELNDVANTVAEQLSKIGISVEVKTFDSTTLNQNIIRPRNYEAILFGQIINNESELFAFWHSSQKNDPGLNISLYENKQVDRYLETNIATQDTATRSKNYKKIEDEILSDIPAIFLYTPHFVYLTKEKTHINSLPFIINSSERFQNIQSWFIESDHVWKIFAPKTKDDTKENTNTNDIEAVE